MYSLAEAHWAGAHLELLAGQLEAAERELRAALRIHLDMGAGRYSAMVRALLAHVLYGQGRDPEALELIDEARDEGAAGDTRYEVLWRTALAKLLARRGETAEGARLAREAVTIVAATDRINMHADALVDLAEVLRAGGEESGAAESLEQAAALYEEKGNELCADRVRTALATLVGGR
jgi:ATP/maltotriose-dependent transcriptional regulator MalT